MKFTWKSKSQVAWPCFDLGQFRNEVITSCSSWRLTLHIKLVYTRNKFIWTKRFRNFFGLILWPIGYSAKHNRIHKAGFRSFSILSDNLPIFIMVWPCQLCQLSCESYPTNWETSGERFCWFDFQSHTISMNFRVI